VLGCDTYATLPLENWSKMFLKTSWIPLYDMHISHLNTERLNTIFWHKVRILNTERISPLLPPPLSSNFQRVRGLHHIVGRYCTNNVPTKTHDGRANDSESAAKSSTNRPRPQPVRKHQDPFVYYSHEETRMNALLLSSGEKMRESSESVKLFDRCTYLSPLVSSTLALVV